MEATLEEVEYLLNEIPLGKEDIKIGSLVEIVSGGYEGFTGLVRNIRDGEITVDLNVFCRMLPVTLKTREIKHVEVGEQWL